MSEWSKSGATSPGVLLYDSAVGPLFDPLLEIGDFNRIYSWSRFSSCACYYNSRAYLFSTSWSSLWARAYCEEVAE